MESFFFSNIWLFGKYINKKSSIEILKQTILQHQQDYQRMFVGGKGECLLYWRWISKLLPIIGADQYIRQQFQLDNITPLYVDDNLKTLGVSNSNPAKVQNIQFFSIQDNFVCLCCKPTFTMLPMLLWMNI